MTCDKCKYGHITAQEKGQPDRWECLANPPVLVCVSYHIVPKMAVQASKTIIPNQMMPQGFDLLLNQFNWIFPQVKPNTPACGQFIPKEVLN